MPRSRLLAVVLLVLAACLTAASQDSKPQDDSAGAPQHNYNRPWANDTSDRSLPATDIVSDPPTRENFCYALNTYIMARENKHSDATRLVAHYTCTPANRFQMKAAVVTPQPQQ